MLFLAGLAACFVVVLYLFFQRQSDEEVYEKFGVSSKTFKLISSDLGKRKSRVFLRRKGVTGVPDAVFEATRGKELVVGEYKSRTHKGYVRFNELYQVMLYMGHLQARYPSYTIRGCLAYADQRVSIAFDPQLYQGLMDVAPEVKKALRKRTVQDALPLQKRMPVNTMNSDLKLRMY